VNRDPLPVFAANVRARRNALGLTQEIVADRAQMEASYWSRVERGAIEPGVRMVTRIAHALETTPARLLAGVEQPIDGPAPDRPSVNDRAVP